MAINQRKAAVIGCGFVGASIAFSLMQRGLFSELVLIDANHRKAEGEAMDLSHGLPYAASMEIYAGTYADAADCALAIVTAGANQKPGETRLDLIGRNVSILGSILPQLTASGFEGAAAHRVEPGGRAHLRSAAHLRLPEGACARLRYGA